MNRLEKLFLRGAAFSIAFAAIYFLLAALMGFTDVSISAWRFLLILLFGYIFALANLTFEGACIPLWVKRLCVYVISALAFLFIFVVGSGIGTTGAKIFAALVIFSGIYGVGLLVISLISRTLKKSNKPKRKNIVNSVKKQDKYKPKFDE